MRCRRRRRRGVFSSKRTLSKALTDRSDERGVSDEELDGSGGDALQLAGAKNFQTVEKSEIIGGDASQEIVQLAHVQRRRRRIRAFVL